MLNRRRQAISFFVILGITGATCRPALEERHREMPDVRPLHELPEYVPSRAGELTVHADWRAPAADDLWVFVVNRTGSPISAPRIGARLQLAIESRRTGEPWVRLQPAGASARGKARNFSLPDDHWVAVRIRRQLVDLASEVRFRLGRAVSRSRRRASWSTSRGGGAAKVTRRKPIPRTTAPGMESTEAPHSAGASPTGATGRQTAELARSYAVSVSGHLGAGTIWTWHTVRHRGTVVLRVDGRRASLTAVIRWHRTTRFPPKEAMHYTSESRYVWQGTARRTKSQLALTLRETKAQCRRLVGTGTRRWIPLGCPRWQNRIELACHTEQVLVWPKGESARVGTDEQARLRRLLVCRSTDRTLPNELSQVVEPRRLVLDGNDDLGLHRQGRPAQVLLRARIPAPGNDHTCRDPDE